MQNELKKVLDSKVISEVTEFMKNDFWRAYEGILRDKLQEKFTDTITHDEQVNLYRSQGASRTLVWVIQEAPRLAIEKMRKPS